MSLLASLPAASDNLRLVGFAHLGVYVSMGFPYLTTWNVFLFQPKTVYAAAFTETVIAAK